MFATYYGKVDLVRFLVSSLDPLQKLTPLGPDLSGPNFFMYRVNCTRQTG